MPITATRCVNTGEILSPQDCIACAEGPIGPRGRCQYTGAILRAMYANDEDRRDAGISASGLTGCGRQTFLKLVEDYTVDPNALWPALRGTLFHYMPERHHADQLIVEVRFRKEYLPGQFLTGKIDEYDPISQTLIDYKSTERLPKPTDLAIDGFKESWVYQTHIYRWLLDGGTRLDTGEVISLPVRRINIIAFSMMAVRRYTVPALKKSEVTSYIIEHADEIQEALDGGAWPRRKYDPERSKLCTVYCPVRESCRSHGE